MKNRVYLYLASAGLLAGAMGCSAPEPSNPLPIGETIYTGNSDNNGGGSNETVDPLLEYHPNDISYFMDRTTADNNIRFSTETLIQYLAANAQPASISGYDVCEDAFGTSNLNKQWTLEYAAGDSYPKSMTRNLTGYTDLSTNLPESYVRINKVSKFDNISFEDGLLKSLEYFEIQYDENGDIIDQTDVQHVELTYDTSKHLVGIKVGDTEYRQEWNAEGDLTKIRSPYFGDSELTYTTVENRFGQWDPELPLFGIFQAFGWIGVAPKHFPKTISTSAPVYGNVSNAPIRTPTVISLDYYLSNGLIDDIHATYTLGESPVTITIGYTNY